MVPVADGVTSRVGSVRVVPVMPACKLKYTTAAPISKIVTRAPSAAGRLSVISGIRLAWTLVSAFFDFVAALTVSSVPHTRQRVAFSLNRVPQVGQTFVFCDEGSWSIRAGIIPLNIFHQFDRPFGLFPYKMATSTDDWVEVNQSSVVSARFLRLSLLRSEQMDASLCRVFAITANISRDLRIFQCKDSVDCAIQKVSIM